MVKVVLMVKVVALVVMMVMMGECRGWKSIQVVEKAMRGDSG